MIRRVFLPAFLLVSAVSLLGLPVSAGTLSCSVTTAAACTSPSVVALRLSNSADAHAELPSQTNSAYDSNVVCCSGVTGLGNSCTGTNATVAKLYATTNSHVEQSSQANYSNLACLSVPAGGSVSIAYQASNCTSQDTTLASMQAATNSHVGNTTAYTTKICGTATGSAATVSFSISANSVGFGTLSSGASRYATSDGLGSATETEAHQLVANTSSPSGYSITVQGATLTSGSYTVSAIGGTNTGAVASIEQFGLRATATGGSGSVTAPYAAAGFAYAATASTPSQIASETTGDGVNTTYSLRYLADIAPQTESGTYTANLTYVMTANF